MNPNARKRLNACSRHDRDMYDRAERKFVAEPKSDKTRLFSPKNAIKESDNMKRINHAEFKTYASGTTRIRVPILRLYAPRICMADGHTITITRQRAARYIREMRADNNRSGKALNSVGALQRKDRAARKASTLMRSDIAAKSDNTTLPVNCTRDAARKAVTPMTDNNPTITIPTGPMTVSPATYAPTTEQASRLWESWMRTARKLTFQQFMDRWVSDNIG